MASSTFPGLQGISGQKTVGEIEDFAIPDMLTPAVQGAFYMFIKRSPSQDIFTIDEMTDVKDMFRVLINKVTLPSVTLATAEMNAGFSGTTKIAAPTNLDIANEITIGFNEQQGYPVLKMIEIWVYAIRDPHTGLSRVEDYNLNNISMDFFMIMTKPVAPIAEEGDDKPVPTSIIEIAIFFRNIFPTTVPLDTLSPNKEASDKVQYDITFKFKNMINNEHTINHASEFLDKIKISHYDHIGWDLSGNNTST